ncbi:MAG: 50S ribosomal protein L14e [Candidatus Bathyarchaeota archaeon]|nr:MAG: 50S ribosomal protein L14e [Candidatus Bathyarchaeota archaeon]
MPAIEVGRVCVKIVGREAGRRCVVVDVVDKNFVVVTGPVKVTGVKRRRVNVGHIEPTEMKVKIGKGDGDNEVVETLKVAGLLDKMKEIVKPRL